MTHINHLSSFLLETDAAVEIFFLKLHILCLCNFVPMKVRITLIDREDKMD